MSQKLLPLKVYDPKLNEHRAWEYFFFDPATGIIYYLRKFNGKYFKFSTRFTIEQPAQAKKFANQEFERRIGKRKVSMRTLIGDELDAWLKVKESENLAQSGMYNIKQAHKDLKAYWGEMWPEEITVDALPDWYSWFKENRGISIENNIKYLRMFCKYLNTKIVNGKPLLPAIPVIRDPEKKQREKKRAEKKERIITPEEFKAIYDAAESLEHRVLAMFMYTMATRITETLKLEFGRSIILDAEEPHYRWAVGSTKMFSLEGMHALPDQLVTILQELKDLRDSEGTTLLFPQLKDKQKHKTSQMIDYKAWRARAGLSDGWQWTNHTFRHTCLTNLFNDEQNNQLMICKLYRVSLKVATKVYIKVQMSSILKLKNAVKVAV